MRLTARGARLPRTARVGAPLRIILSARRSDLARIQTRLVGDRLLEVFPDLEIAYSFRESRGDQDLKTPLWMLPDKGAFTEDLTQDLREGRTDMVVHSWKDLPLEESPDTRIAATLPRGDMRDLLLLRSDRAPRIERTGQLTLLTSSPRRAHNLDPFLREALPWRIEAIQFEPVRGNIPTRLSKLLADDADGLVAAKAAVDRLLTARGEEFEQVRGFTREALDRCRLMVLPLSANPAAAGQGAVAVQIARQREDLAELLAAVDDGITRRTVEEERRILAAHGGGCHQRIGVSVLARDYGRVVSVRGVTDDGQALERWSLESSRPGIPATELDKVWPPAPTGDAWFEREPRGPVPQPPVGSVFWVARAEALPRDWSISEQQWIWTGGLKTWRKLARRGVWVNGSADGLGEREDPALGALTGGPLRFLKLTHEEGFVTEDGTEILPTYRLAPHNSVPDLRGKTHFWWSSGSGFRAALRLYPEIAAAWHACGPGNTHAILSGTLASDERVRVRLDHAAWLAEVLGRVP